MVACYLFIVRFIQRDCSCASLARLRHLSASASSFFHHSHIDIFLRFHPLHSYCLFGGFFIPSLSFSVVITVTIVTICICDFVHCIRIAIFSGFFILFESFANLLYNQLSLRLRTHHLFCGQYEPFEIYDLVFIQFIAFYPFSAASLNHLNASDISSFTPWPHA